MTDPGDIDNPLLVQLASATADGSDVDWAAADASAAAPDEHDLIRELQIISALSQALRECAQEAPAPAAVPLPGTTAGSGDAPADAGSDSVSAWGPLRIVAQVGSGSFGRVFRAWEPRLEREVALKLLDSIPIGKEASVVAEARLLARIRHENIVTVFGADHFDSVVGFWMEYIEGCTLSQIQHDQGPLGAQEALLIGMSVCRALAAVHRAGFVHSDIKAANVMRQVGGRIVLMDFGAARMIRVAGDRRQRTFITPYYVAPEVLRGAPPTPRSDLYSLGVLLYYLVTGSFPVSGESLDDFRLAHANGRRTLLRDVRPDLPAAFIRVVDAAMAALPDERPESAGVLEALIQSAAGYAATSRPSRGAGAGDSSEEASVAVLPFADLSEDHGLAYFCEGIAEEIIDALASSPGLRVVPRASAFAFAPDESNAHRLASALNVRTLLQGSVRASGKQLRISARLTDVVSGEQLWSERFTRDLSDIFGIQDEIARAVVRGLGMRLKPSARAASSGGAGVQSSEAYAMYLKGRHCWNQRTEAALQKSADYFHAAIEKEPEYGHAYAALAEAYTTLGLYGVLAPDDIMPRAKAAAGRAIEIAPDLSSPHATAGCIAAVYEWKWTDAARHYHRALESHPHDPAAHHWYAINYLVPLRRFDEAAAELRRAAESDPLSMPITVSLGMRSYFAHEFEQASRELGDTVESDPGSATARLFLGMTLVEMARYDEALRELEAASHIGRSPEITAALGYASARAGHLDRAATLLAELLELARRRYVSPSLVAQINAGSGNADAAIDWLRRAIDVRAMDLAWLAVRPVFDGLRADPRFNALVARMRQ